MNEHKCKGLIFYMYRAHACGKKAGYKHEGGWFCKTHHPPTILEKRIVRNAQYTAKSVAKAAREKEAKDFQIEMKRKAAMFDELLEALKDMGARYGLTDVARAAIAKAEGGAA